MPRIQPIDLNRTDSRTAETLSQVRAKLGRLPNLITTLARAPAALDGYLQLSQAIAGGRLSARQRELIAIAVAEQNDCDYCLSAHAALGKLAGLNADTIEDARQGRATDPLEAAVIALALTIVRSRGGVSDAELESAREAGLDDEQIVEIVANVALNVMTNYVNRVANTTVDFPTYSSRAAA